MEIPTITPPDEIIPPSSDKIQHSEGAVIDPRVAEARIARLRAIFSNARKPHMVFDIDAYPVADTDTKPLDQLCVEAAARRITTSKSDKSLDDVNLICILHPERIVKVATTKVDGAPVRGDSAHGVIFARVGTQRGRLVDAAVKTFDDEPTNAFREFVNASEVARRGIHTLQPLAVVIDPGQEPKDRPLGFYLSEMESIRSMDRLLPIRRGLQYLRTEEGQKHADYLGYVAVTGELLANMHLRGIFPADPQLKNFAARDSGEVIPIDFESTSIYPPSLLLTDPEKFARRASRGLSVLRESMSGVKTSSIPFFAGFSGERLWSAFNETVLSVYCDSFELAILKMGEAKAINVDQFSQALDTLDQIRQAVHDNFLKPTTT